MSHQEKQHLFDEYASQFEEFGNFEGMVDAVLSTAIHKEELIYRIFECCDLVQEQQQKRIYENATTKTVFTAYGPQQAVEKNSIINPENKIQ